MHFDSLPIRNLLTCIFTHLFQIEALPYCIPCDPESLTKISKARSEQMIAFSDVKYLPAFGYIFSNRFWLDGWNISAKSFVITLILS